MNEPVSYYTDPTYGQLPPRRTVWPKVLGIMGIVFGGAALLSGIFVWLAPGMIRAPYEALGLPAEFFQRHSMNFDVIPLIGAGLGLLLLLASILLIMRRQVGRVLILVWALLKVIFAFWQMPHVTALQREFMPLQMKVMKETQKDQAAQLDMTAMADMMISVTQVVGLAWLCALPIFMLIWLSRGKIRLEVATWEAPTQPSNTIA